MYYGNGTSKLWSKSPWRKDEKKGVVLDLAPHLLDVYLFLFKYLPRKNNFFIKSKNENTNIDYAQFGFEQSKFIVKFTNFIARSAYSIRELQRTSVRVYVRPYVRPRFRWFLRRVQACVTGSYPPRQFFRNLSTVYFTEISERWEHFWTHFWTPFLSKKVKILQKRTPNILGQKMIKMLKECASRHLPCRV